MFRAATSPMEASVVKATDEALVAEDWSLILDICDRVSTTPQGPSQAVSALIKRLAHRNANVQLYTLELANALSQNCGPELHRELASKAFTDALLRLASDRNSHTQVKQKVFERMAGWTEQFKGSHELGIMEQSYGKLKTSQPGLMPPSKPVKQQISGDDRRKEEEELQMALALSVQESKAPAAQTNGSVGDDSQPQPAQTAPGAQAQGTTAATVSRVRALYDFTPSEAGELAFKKNDIIAVLESVYKDWWKGSLRGQTGIFPLNYVEKLKDPTKEELERDADMESEVFGEVRNVEKLLALLSTETGSGRRGEREEDEIADLYQRTVSIRPKLVELIGKYSQKKDDFTQLNEKFIKARRDYEALLEASMSQPQRYQQQYPVRQPHRQGMAPPHMYAPQQHQQPYAIQPPPAGYPPQGGPPPQNFAPYASQSSTHLPPPQQPQQEPPRFYSPAPPSEAPPQQQTQPSYPSPYPPSAGAAPKPATAPFHFIPGGVQPPPPQQDPQLRRKPSPQTSDPYTQPPQQQLPPQHLQQPQFQGQIRPNSIHTLNSGNPQELATGGYESPVDNRHSYPPAQQQQPQYAPPGPPVEGHGYDPYAQAPPVQQVPGQRSDLQDLPSRQRTHSFESPSSAYSQHPPQGDLGQGQGGYQAYQPQPQGLGAAPGVGQGGAGDPGDYYR
nr:hypothetical protein B0A51_03528 [Rachicladosporium sp. CCFEE 5018]